MKVPAVFSIFSTVNKMIEQLFTVTTDLIASGDQPAAIAEIEQRINNGDQHIVLHGATGTGKSATTAWAIERANRPTLVLAPNKVLAAQLAAELRELLPDNKVCYFVSHFAYYRPEAYIPSTDTYVEKDSAIDDEIERLRHDTTFSLLTRSDVVVVASVSAIYGLGRPEEYRRRLTTVSVGDPLDRDALIRKLVEMEYKRNDVALERGRIRVRGDVIDIVPASGEHAYRVGFFGDEIESLAVIDPVTGERIETPERVSIPPASHHVFDPELLNEVLIDIRNEFSEQHALLTRQGKLLEAQRLKQRTEADLESLETLGFCRGIENYSRHFDRRSEGVPPSTLIDFFPNEFLTVVDESHVTVPQISAMFEGDQSRKRVLVDHGFRLPSALDNRPLRSSEFWSKVGPVLYLSATPGKWEAENGENGYVEQVIRPTGLVDPLVHVVQSEGRLEDLLSRARERRDRNERTLVTTLTKRQAEQLSDWFTEQGFKVKYLHHEVDTVERIATLRQLRLGEIDMVVGVNLLREGLDLPEVSLVAVIDADTQGFLRSATSLIQTIGRAARNPNGEVILYANQRTPAMIAAINETDRRRAKQIAHNLANGITPTALVKPVRDVMEDQRNKSKTEEISSNKVYDNPSELAEFLQTEIERAAKSMKDCSSSLRFEEAAAWRDEIGRLRRALTELRATSVEIDAI
jgi:excinuclease ABC subunit B